MILLGPPGMGKTHLAISLLLRTAELGHRVYFTTALDLARRLSKAVAENRLHRQLAVFMQPKVLVLDEVGYLSLESAHASLLFQVITKRYEKHQPLILTSNKAFGEWGQVFGGDQGAAACASTAHPAQSGALARAARPGSPGPGDHPRRTPGVV